MSKLSPTSIWLSFAGVCLLVGVYFQINEQPNIVQPKVSLEVELPVPEPPIPSEPEPIVTAKPQVSLSDATATVQKEPLLVSINADGKVFLGEELLPDWQLFNAFFQLALQHDAETVYFRAEQTVPYKEVMRIMNEASSAGFMNLALVIDSSEKSTSQEPQPLVSGAIQFDAEAESSAASTANSTGNTLTEGALMTAQDKHGVGASINSCWNIGSLSSAAQRVKLVMRVAMNKDGTPDSPSIQMVSFEGGDEAAAQQSFEAAKRAVMRGARGCGGQAGYQNKFAKGNAPEVLQIRFDVTSGAMLD